MIHFLPLSRVFAAVAVLYGVLVAAILWITFDASTTLADSIGIALAGATSVNLAIFLWFVVGWKWLWDK